MDSPSCFSSSHRLLGVRDCCDGAAAADASGAGAEKMTTSRLDTTQLPRHDGEDAFPVREAACIAVQRRTACAAVRRHAARVSSERRQHSSSRDRTRGPGVLV
jgi:hypothetical protein